MSTYQLKEYKKTDQKQYKQHKDFKKDCKKQEQPPVVDQTPPVTTTTDTTPVVVQTTPTAEVKTLPTVGGSTLIAPIVLGLVVTAGIFIVREKVINKIVRRMV